MSRVTYHHPCALIAITEWGWPGSRTTTSRPGSVGAHCARRARIAYIVLGAGVGLVLLLTLGGYWLPSQVEAMRISATVQASSAEFMMSRRTITVEDLGDNRSRVSWVETNEATNPLMRYVLVLSASSINDNLSGMLTLVAPVINPESVPAPGR